MIKKLFGQREISDWINPVLMKELKQAVRSRQFVGVFVLVQIVMILFVTFGMAAATGTNDIEEMSAFFWGIVGVYMLLILPITGLNALAREFDDARLDLLQLSSMNSRAIVLGKWLSLNVQGLLVVLSLLPYIVLRYFVGSVNPLQDLVVLAMLMYVSLIFSGGAICVSVVRSKILRFIAMFALGACMLFLPELIEEMGLVNFNTWPMVSAAEYWIGVPLVLVFSLLIGGLFLEFSSAQISPAAENHESPKRFYLIGILALSGLAYWVDLAPGLFLSAFIISMIAVSVSCIVNEPIALPGIYARFLRFGAAGKRLGRLFFYPGWAAGSNFVVAMFAAAITMVFFQYNHRSSMDIEYVGLLLLGVLGSLLMPRAVVLLLKLRESGLRFFMLIQLVIVCVIILAMLTESWKRIEITSLLFFLPQASVLCIGMIDDEPYRFSLFFIGNAIVTTISYFIILGNSWKLRHFQAELEEQAAAINAREKAQQATALSAQTAAAEA